ncbi:MAG: bile acid:sodium symporter family protein [Sphingobium sp.]
MISRLKGALDPYILALLTTMVAATLFPARGAAVTVFAVAADIAIVLLFFFHGAKLSRDAILAGAGNWRLHVAVLAATFAIFPALGLLAACTPGLPPVVASGVVFLTLLPSTVQSSIAFTSIARGNVAAAVCSASFSNLLGIFLTPLLVALLMGAHGASISWDAVEKICLQLLLPFVAGHLLRPVIGGFVSRHRALISYSDRGSILIVVYSAFSAAVVGGLWQRMPPQVVALILLVSALILALILAITWMLGRALHLSREDAIVLLFCGSKKSLATGVPMAGVLFAPALVGVMILPLMLFHQLQLIACAVIARRFARADETAGSA